MLIAVKPRLESRGFCECRSYSCCNNLILGTLCTKIISMALGSVCLFAFCNNQKTRFYKPLFRINSLKACASSL